MIGGNDMIPALIRFGYGAKCGGTDNQDCVRDAFNAHIATTVPAHGLLLQRSIGRDMTRLAMITLETRDTSRLTEYT